MGSEGPYRRNDPRLMSSLELAVTQVRRPGPVELAWNWHRELGLLAGLAAAAGFVASRVGLIGLAVTAGTGLAAGAAALLCWPSARRWAIARAWCLITPHRVRAGCKGAWVQTRSGRLPFVMTVTPAPYGEQVRLWLFAGLTAADLEAARDVLAAACWATEVRVIPSTRRAHLVTLQVVRNQSQERTSALFLPWSPWLKWPGTSRKEYSPRLTPDAWPPARRGADDGLGDAEERDTSSWPWAEAG